MVHRWVGGGRDLFFKASGGGAKQFFAGLRGGANLFFSPPEGVFIRANRVIIATSLTCLKINSFVYKFVLFLKIL